MRKICGMKTYRTFSSYKQYRTQSTVQRSLVSVIREQYSAAVVYIQRVAVPLSVRLAAWYSSTLYISRESQVLCVGLRFYSIGMLYELSVSQADIRMFRMISSTW